MRLVLVNVVVTNPDSQSGTLTNGYTYTAPPPAPTITSFSPTSGSVGKKVTINGTNFTGATSVKFNGTSGQLYRELFDQDHGDGSCRRDHRQDQRDDARRYGHQRD